MSKKILLAASALSAIVFAGSAMAQSTVTPRALTFRATPAVAGDIDSATVGAGGTYRLAQEANLAPNASATVALVDTLSTGAALPSGNVILEVSLTNATFGSAFGSANINVTGIAGCSSFTAAPSTGGGANDSTAVFVISNSTATCNAFNIDVPVRPTLNGQVTVTSTLRTDGNPGTPLDGGSRSLAVITPVDAFQVVINGALTSGSTAGGALLDSFADLNLTPVYSGFQHNTGAETADVAQLGTIAIAVDTTAYADLASTSVRPGDVTDADVVVTGNFSAFDGTGGGVTLGTGTGSAATVTSSTATINNSQGSLAQAATAVTGVPFRVNVETGGIIPVSSYNANVSYTLRTGYAAQGAVSGALETIERAGTNVVLPWMNSSSVQASTGTTNVVRLGNVGNATTGAVYAQVLNSTAGGYTPSASPVQLFPNILAGGERVITTEILTNALGEFGRGDVQLSIEALPGTVTAKRYAQRPGGTFTEVESGTVASDQNAPNVP